MGEEPNGIDDANHSRMTNQSLFFHRLLFAQSRTEAIFHWRFVVSFIHRKVLPSFHLLVDFTRFVGSFSVTRHSMFLRFFPTGFSFRVIRPIFSSVNSVNDIFFLFFFFPFSIRSFATRFFCCRRHLHICRHHRSFNLVFLISSFFFFCRLPLLVWRCRSTRLYFANAPEFCKKIKCGKRSAKCYWWHKNRKRKASKCVANEWWAFSRDEKNEVENIWARKSVDGNKELPSCESNMRVIETKCQRRKDIWIKRWREAKERRKTKIWM